MLNIGRTSPTNANVTLCNQKSRSLEPRVSLFTQSTINHSFIVVFLAVTWMWVQYQSGQLSTSDSVKKYHSLWVYPHCWSWFSVCELNSKCALFFSQVRLQTQPKPKPGESLIYKGTMDCFKKTFAQEVRMHARVIGIIQDVSAPSPWCFLLVLFSRRV